MPFVLLRSSTYQVRPRNVRTACWDEANWSSTTIALLTSRPRVVIASRARRAPLGGLAGRRGDDDEPAELRRRLARRRAQVAEERPGDPEQEQVEEGEEQEPDDPDRDDVKPSIRRWPPTELDDEDRVPDPDLVAFAEGDLLDPPVVDPRAVRAPEIGQEQGTLAAVDPGMVARRAAVLRGRARCRGRDRSSAGGRRPRTTGVEPSGRISRRVARGDSTTGTTKTAVWSIRGCSPVVAGADRRRARRRVGLPWRRRPRLRSAESRLVGRDADVAGLDRRVGDEGDGRPVGEV